MVFSSWGVNYFVGRAGRGGQAALDVGEQGYVSGPGVGDWRLRLDAQCKYFRTGV